MYTEILKLKKMLEDAKIPFTFTDDFHKVKSSVVKDYFRRLYPAYQIRLNENLDAIEFYGSYGAERDLIEIMGGLTAEEREDNSVLGYLTAEEVFKRFKYCYEHGVDVYINEEEDE